MKKIQFFGIFVLFIFLLTGALSGCATGTQTMTPLNKQPGYGWVEPQKVESQPSASETTEKTTPVLPSGVKIPPAELFNEPAQPEGNLQPVPRPDEQKVKNEMTLAEVAKLAQENRAWLTQHEKAIKELSLMVVLNRYYIQHGGPGAIVPIRHFFKSGSVVPSEAAKKDYALICQLERAGKVKLKKVEGYSDDTGIYNTNARITWQRVDSIIALYSGACCDPVGVELQAFAGVNFQGTKKDNRSTIGYVEVLAPCEPGDLKLDGNILPPATPRPVKTE